MWEKVSLESTLILFTNTKIHEVYYMPGNKGKTYT